MPLLTSAPVHPCTTSPLSDGLSFHAFQHLSPGSTHRPACFWRSLECIHPSTAHFIGVSTTPSNAILRASFALLFFMHACLQAHSIWHAPMPGTVTSRSPCVVRVLASTAIHSFVISTSSHKAQDYGHSCRPIIGATGRAALLRAGVSTPLFQDAYKSIVRSVQEAASVATVKRGEGHSREQWGTTVQLEL